VGIREEGRSYIAKYGFMFEEYRGPPVVREEASYEYDPERSRVNRGEVVLADRDNCLQLPRFTGIQFRLYPFHFHLTMKMFDLVKLIVLACLVTGSGSDDAAKYILLCLLVLSLGMLLAVRLTKPYLNRWDMALGLFVESMDVLVYACLYSILYNDPDDLDRSERVGVIMLVAQSLALAFMVVRYAFVTMYVTITCVAYLKRRSVTGFSKAVDEVLQQHFPVYLEHKYFDRWMVNVLHRGLHDRPVKLSELPRSVAAQRCLQNICNSVSPLFVPRRRGRQRND